MFFIHVQCLTIRCTMSPDLFGTPGKASSKLYFSQLLHLCIRWLVQLLVGGGSCIHTTHMECNTGQETAIHITIINSNVPLMQNKINVHQKPDHKFCWSWQPCPSWGTEFVLNVVRGVLSMDLIWILNLGGLFPFPLQHPMVKCHDPPSIASQVSGVLAKCLPKSSRPLCFTKVSTTPQ